MKERPFSCNLNNAEVFSCVIGREAESSLSIIDPVTINFEIGASREEAIQGHKHHLAITWAVFWAFF